MTGWHRVQCWWISATILVDFQPLRISNLLGSAISCAWSAVGQPAGRMRRARSLGEKPIDKPRAFRFSASAFANAA
jgi:hypothetical protein